MKSLRRAGLLLIATASVALPLISCTAVDHGPTSIPPPSRLVVTGRAGPFPAASATVRRTGTVEAGGFFATLETGIGQTFALSGPDEPAEMVIVEPRAILFAPIDGADEHGLIILYNSSRIGPGNGTSHKALVYKIGAAGGERLPLLEAQLEGVATVSAALEELGNRR